MRVNSDSPAFEGIEKSDEQETFSRRRFGSAFRLVPVWLLSFALISCSLLFGEKEREDDDDGAVITGEGAISGQVRDALTNAPVASVRVVVRNGSNREVANAATDAQGSYLIEVPSGPRYVIRYEKQGYLPAEYANVELQPDEVTYLSQILYIDSQYSGNGIIRGQVKNALNGQGVPGLTLELRQHVNATTGATTARGTTGTNGSYEFGNVPAGYYTVTAMGTGFNTTSFSVLSIGGYTLNGQDGTITPVLSESEVRIILTWGEEPSDLDSHLTGPNASGGRFHIYFANKRFDLGGTTHAFLDLDDVSSFGPETVTIYQRSSGMYRYSVHDFTNLNSSPTRPSSAMSNSNARVQVYTGNTLRATFHVPTNQPGNIWTVFEMTDGQIRSVNTVGYTANVPFKQTGESDNDAAQIGEVGRAKKGRP